MNLLYWVWLQTALGFGGKYLKPLLEKFNTAENIYNAQFSDFKTCEFLSSAVLEKLCNKSTISAKKILADAKDCGITIVPFISELYPENLREIPNPPVLLYIKGNAELLKEETMLCVVGPREVSVFGKKAAFSLSARLSLAGFTIVSGGALGTDTAAHKGALYVGGNTICVLGCGIAADYLKANKQLRATIADKGLIISEFPPFYKASKITFPVRNRILSGLALGTVVIEGKFNSGAIITANAANEQGKDVFVIPGNPTEEHYKGSNKLLRDGAKPLLELNDILFEYLPIYPHKINLEKAYSQKISMKSEQVAIKNEKTKASSKIIKKNIQENLSNNAKIVYNHLDKPIFYLDEINVADLSNAEILATLTELEIYGYIKALPGGKYGLLN